MTSGSVERIPIIAADGTRAEIAPALGGVVSSLQFPTPAGACEVLFRHDFFWDPENPGTRGGIPLLFPACGRVRRAGAACYRVAGRDYALPLHGFALRWPWTVASGAEDSLMLSLRADAAMRAVYPFEFALRARYRVRPRALEIELAIQNEGDTAMPFSAGWHPYFRTPDAPAKDALHIDLPATASGRYDETFTQILGWGAPLGFPLHPNHPRFCDTLHRAGPGPARVRWSDGFGIAIEASSGGGAMPFWQLHTEPGKPFVCVEPWSSPPNALNSGLDLLRLMPGAVWAMALSIKSESNR